jgi:hypothetical protein
VDIVVLWLVAVELEVVSVSDVVVAVTPIEVPLLDPPSVMDVDMAPESAEHPAAATARTSAFRIVGPSYSEIRRSSVVRAAGVGWSANVTTQGYRASVRTSC